MLLWIMVESREAHVLREWLLHTPFKKAEVCSLAFLVTVQLQASPTNLCLVRQVPAQLHLLCCGPALTPNCMASFSWQTLSCTLSDHTAASYIHTKPHGGPGPFYILPNCMSASSCGGFPYTLSSYVAFSPYFSLSLHLFAMLCLELPVSPHIRPVL